MHLDFTTELIDASKCLDQAPVGKNSTEILHVCLRYHCKRGHGDKIELKTRLCRIAFRNDDNSRSLAETDGAGHLKLFILNGGAVGQ